MSDIERRGGELERLIPQGQIADRKTQELALVGLSPEFPMRLKELNDALVRNVDGSFTGFRFTLHPDEDHPKIDVDARHDFPYDVVIDAHTNHAASLDIRPRANGLNELGRTRMSQIRTFTDTYPTEQPIMVTAEPRRAQDDEEELASINVPFADLTSTQDLADLGIVPARFSLDLGFRSGRTRFSMPMGYVIEPRFDEPVFRIQEVHATDSSANIEFVVGSLALLLAKTPFDE